MTVKELTSKMDMYQPVLISASWTTAGFYRCTAGEVPVRFNRCEVIAIGTHDNSSEIVIDVRA